MKTIKRKPKSNMATYNSVAPFAPWFPLSNDFRLLAYKVRRNRFAMLVQQPETCEHGQGLTDYCQPCGRIHGGG